MSTMERKLEFRMKELEELTIKMDKLKQRTTVQEALLNMANGKVMGLTVQLTKKE